MGDDTKNGCVADYSPVYVRLSLCVSDWKGGREKRKRERAKGEILTACWSVTSEGIEGPNGVLAFTVIWLSAKTLALLRLSVNFFSYG